MGLFSSAAIFAIYILNPQGHIDQKPVDQFAPYFFVGEVEQRTYEDAEDCEKDKKKAVKEWERLIDATFNRGGTPDDADPTYQAQLARLDSLTCYKIEEATRRRNNADIARQVQAGMKAQQPAVVAKQAAPAAVPASPALESAPPQSEEMVESDPSPAAMALPPVERRYGSLPTKPYFMAEAGRRLDGSWGWVKYSTAFLTPAQCWGEVKRILKDDEENIHRSFAQMQPNFSSMSWYQTQLNNLNVRRRKLTCVAG